MEYKNSLNKYIEIALKEEGSDIHLTAGSPPAIRVTGSLVAIAQEPELTPEDTLGILSVMISSEERERFLQTKEIDFSYSLEDGTRFRGNGFFQQGSVGIALRLIPSTIRSIEELGLPQILESFARRKQGFFLVVGPVGQGKTTTLAALIDLINSERSEHILTIEDPIEYVFKPKMSLVDQREVKIDTEDFATALSGAFRQDIDVLLIGEMRDPQTMAAAVTAAETGHLVFSTLHTNNAAQTVNRIIDSFPPDQQDQIRLQLASSLAGIFSQRLVPRIGGGLVPAYELLIANKAVANLIREKRTHELNTVIETGAKDGMIDMSRTLAELVASGEISAETAYQYSLNPKILDRLL